MNDIIFSLEEVSVRIENYLENLEKNPENQQWVKQIKSGKYREKDVDGVISYLQQRAKLTAYLWMISVLDPNNHILQLIARRRGTKILDSDRGIAHDSMAYQAFDSNGELWQKVFQYYKKRRTNVRQNKKNK